MRAMTWPLLTWSLKSTCTSVTWPEIWLPTSTVEIALSVPVAEIATRMSPRSTAAVRNAPCAASALRWVHHQPAAMSASRTMATATERGGRAKRFLRAGAEREAAMRKGRIRGKGCRRRERAVARRVDHAPRPRFRGSGNELDRRQRAAAGHALQYHRPAETFTQAAHDRQAQAHAAGVLVGAIERIEGPLQRFARHADAGIAHGDAVLPDAHFDVAAV